MSFLSPLSLSFSRRNKQRKDSATEAHTNSANYYSGKLAEWPSTAVVDLMRGFIAAGIGFLGVLETSAIIYVS